MNGAPLRASWLGTVAYGDALGLQERARAAVLDGSGEEIVLTLEHPAVITLGRSADRSNVLLDGEALARRGVALHQTSRGGDVTYHGPGQLVAYPIVRVPDGARAFVCALAEAVLDVVRPLGVEDAEYRCDEPGVWIGHSKLCAFGVHLSRGVSMHGLALNVNTELDAFSAIVPCGLRDRSVTSLHALLGDRSPSVSKLAPALAAAIVARLGRTLASFDSRCNQEPET